MTSWKMKVWKKLLTRRSCRLWAHLKGGRGRLGQDERSRRVGQELLKGSVNGTLEGHVEGLVSEGKQETGNSKEKQERDDP